ncbi:hypothetical protein RHRU231_690007 [Rhodococcus ruber]|uniref:Uncharacterized protein n=1 Tax=Rhodococcus ruber TaxID=1830 RepID=A0A098BPY7_9NOCA|nr:hypothetical protein RHRU231_690007 [Rhodococcus ruber]
MATVVADVLIEFVGNLCVRTVDVRWIIRLVSFERALIALVPPLDHRHPDAIDQFREGGGGRPGCLGEPRLKNRDGGVDGGAVRVAELAPTVRHDDRCKVAGLPGRLVNRICQILRGIGILDDALVRRQFCGPAVGQREPSAIDESVHVQSHGERFLSSGRRSRLLDNISYLANTVLVCTQHPKPWRHPSLVATALHIRHAYRALICGFTT